MPGARSMTDVEAHEDYPYIHHLSVASGTGGRGTGVGFQWSVDSPHALADDPFPGVHIVASQFPNGITVTDIDIGISAASAGYEVILKKLTSPTDGSPVTIESVATAGAAQEASDDGTIDNPDVAAGDWLFLDFPTTVMAWCQVSVTYDID